MEKKVIAVQLLNIEDYGSKVRVNYTQHFSDGSLKTLRRNVVHLPNYYNLSRTDLIAAEYWGKVYCGFLNGDVRLLFAVKLRDGSAQLIQGAGGHKIQSETAPAQ